MNRSVPWRTPRAWLLDLVKPTRSTTPLNFGELTWTSPPPRVTVLIESQLTIQPDSAEWVAIVRYDVLGGALDSIHLKVPTAWTANAQIEMSGNL